ncbi:MAG: hypothetical protein MSG64_09465 [Pyrinomonadaceae bacterium MAG19_C2-C3]|nr:hypothetical protein [Pyrinomonadaceae bacterium MAG19_C2-C3]
MKKNFLLSPTLRHLTLILAVFTFAGIAQATTWNGIEPLKSTRADVERALGKPIEEDAAGAPDALRFRVAGGTVTVAFVDKKFVENKKLNAALEGTVLQIILQHETATDTPDTLKLNGNSDFVKESGGNTTTYRNVKDGIYYTFVENRLRTTRYSPSAEELKKATKQ